jgi:hypothetical protein
VSDRDVLEPGITLRELRQIIRDRIVKAADRPLGDGDADERRHERLGDGERRHHRISCPAIGIPLESDVVVDNDDERLRLGLGQELIEIADTKRRGEDVLDSILVEGNGERTRLGRCGQSSLWEVRQVVADVGLAPRDDSHHVLRGVHRARGQEPGSRGDHRDQDDGRPHAERSATRHSSIRATQVNSLTLGLEREAIALGVSEHRPPSKAELGGWLREIDAPPGQLAIRVSDVGASEHDIGRWQPFRDGRPIPRPARGPAEDEQHRSIGRPDFEPPLIAIRHVLCDVEAHPFRPERLGSILVLDVDDDFAHTTDAHRGPPRTPARAGSVSMRVYP